MSGRAPKRSAKSPPTGSQKTYQPLTIRGYFSEKSHPLLAPLVPQIRDLLSEYKAVGGGIVCHALIRPIAIHYVIYESLHAVVLLDVHQFAAFD